MRIVWFCHSLRSDWNHGNAHFLRGIVSELQGRGHDVRVFEPRGGWSAAHLAADHGDAALEAYREAYPSLTSQLYDRDTIDLDRALDGASLVVVHEWTDAGLVARIGAHRARTRTYRLLFHDTHHRSVTRPEEIAALELGDYDGVLAYGEAIRQRYLDRGWAARVWTWHEAADTRVFHPPARVGADEEDEQNTRPDREQPADEADTGDLIWVGNWGDEERRRELHTFLLEPARALGLRTHVYGVRYPPDALDALAAAGCVYRGWTANYRVPALFARHRVTVHVPRQAYVHQLTGIPTIRPFEALACAIPLVSAPWTDAEGLFTPGRDYLVASSGAEMQQHLRDLLHDPQLARALALHGRATILRRHTCAHRVDELLAIVRDLSREPCGESISPFSQHRTA